MAVLVYTQSQDSSLKKNNWELISYARALADNLGTSLSAVTIGDVDETELKKIGSYGVEAIHSVSGESFAHLDNQAYTAAIAQAAETADAGIIIMANDFTGKALAPRVAVRLQAGLASGVVALPDSTEPFRIRKKAFSGKAFATVAITTGKKVLTMEPNSFEAKEQPKDPVIKPMEPSMPENHRPPQVTDTSKTTDKILLTDADIIVSGGRGMKGPEHWKPLEQLAEELGAATACSRPVSDEGWRPEEEHVGQTGKIVAPNLYIALGISGAIQHLAGVSGSKVIVAVNKDPEAPIFQAADYGILGDLKEELPNLIEAARAFKEQS